MTQELKRKLLRMIREKNEAVRQGNQVKAVVLSWAIAAVVDEAYTEKNGAQNGRQTCQSKL